MLVLAFFDTRFQSGGDDPWEKLRAARPASRQHFSLNLPSTLGFYDLAKRDQAAPVVHCARQTGIDGFVIDLRRRDANYHHDGALLAPFCDANFGLAFRWRNGDENAWRDAGNQAVQRERAQQLVAQLAGQPCRMLDGRIVLIVDKPAELGAPDIVAGLLRNEAKQQGLPGLFLLANRAEDKGRFLEHGFDSLIDPSPEEWHSTGNMNRVSGLDYLEVLAGLKDSAEYLDRFFPYLAFTVSRTVNREKRGRSLPRVFAAFHNWLAHPDGGATHLVAHNNRPHDTHLFGLFVENAMLFTHAHFPQSEQAIFLQSWNGWLEGSQVEPSLLDGDLLLNATRDAIDRGRYMIRTRGETQSGIEQMLKERIALLCEAARHTLG